MELLLNNSLDALVTSLDMPLSPIMPKWPSMLNLPKKRIQEPSKQLRTSTGHLSPETDKFSTPAHAKNARTAMPSGPHEPRIETYVYFIMEQTPCFNKSDDAARQQTCAEPPMPLHRQFSPEHLWLSSNLISESLGCDLCLATPRKTNIRTTLLM
jgi:hypothetical protein